MNSLNHETVSNSLTQSNTHEIKSLKGREERPGYRKIFGEKTGWEFAKFDYTY